jgi:CubicO group peptidase (beta-lactamase class C family)
MWNGTRVRPEAWVDQATARQTSNGSNPSSDWDQGYGYQFWRSRHGYRGDGAFGQYMLILPEYDAVVAITSGVRDMQAVMNVVWDKLLPAMRADSLPADLAAQRALQARLGALVMRPAPGRASSPAASRISRRWYTVPSNNRGIQAIALDLTSRAPAVLVRTIAGESRTPLGMGSWVRSTSGFANGMEHFLAVPAQPAVALSGGWTSDSVFTLKIAAVETPYYSVMTFSFHGDAVTLDTEHNVNFGPTRPPRLEGQAAARTR